MKPRKYDLDYALEKVFTDPGKQQKTVDRLEEETGLTYVSEITPMNETDLTFLMRQKSKLTLVDFLGNKLCDGCEPEKGRKKDIFHCAESCLLCKNAVVNVLKCMEDGHYSEHKIK